MIKIILCVILILIAITSIGVFVYIKYGEKTDTKTETNSLDFAEQDEQITNEQQIEQDENVLSELETVEISMPDEMGDYKVLGLLEIPKIEVKKYILDYCTYESLDLAVAKFWGKEGIHGAGNFSIIGHNYRGIFHDLKELEIDDTFILTDKQGRQCTYVIYDIYTVEPEDVTCIEDTLDGQREVTLITCTPGGAKRLILKAKEQK